MSYKTSKLALVALCALAPACGGSETQGATEPETSDPGLELGDDDSAHEHGPPAIDGDDSADDGVQIEGLRGHLDPSDIQRGIDPVAGDIATCFDSRVRRQRFLGGHVELFFVVSPDGTVKTVKVAKSDLGAWPVERCLLEVAAALQFPEPTGNSDAEFTLPLDFPPRKGSLWWTEEQADGEVAEVVAELDECKPRPRDVWVTLYVGVRGAVQEVGFASPSKRGIDPAWADCAAEKILAWTLSDPRGKIAKVGFRYRPE